MIDEALAVPASYIICSIPRPRGRLGRVLYYTAWGLAGLVGSIVILYSIFYLATHNGWRCLIWCGVILVLCVPLAILKAREIWKEEIRKQDEDRKK